MGSVHVASVIDGDDRQEALPVVDLVDHAEVTSSSAVLAFEVKSKWSSNAMGIVGQTAVRELDAGCRDLLR